MLAGLGCPAIAIVRHHLYDIDILINRTLVYVTLTATFVYFGGVAGLQRLLSPVIGEGNGLAVVASTLLIAALFNPLRRRIQAFLEKGASIGGSMMLGRPWKASPPSSGTKQTRRRSTTNW